MEYRRIPAFRQLNDDRIRGALAGIILSQANTQFRGFRPDYGISSRIVARCAAKYLDTEQRLFDLVRFAVEGMLHNAAKKPGKPLVPHECRTGQDPVQLLPYGLCGEGRLHSVEKQFYLIISALAA